MANPALAFEHQVIRPLRALKPGGEVWLLAVSGGVDSMTLAEVLFRWRKLLKVEIHVAHVHHGRAGRPGQKRFRDRAQKAVARWCAEREIPFLTNKPETVTLKSEADLREYRMSWLQSWSEQFEAHRIVFAHHRDDLVETRILRLIRGTGAYGLRGMRLRHGNKLRPLLDCSRAEIETYAAARQLSFVEDPSNGETNALRNWLRHEWLPQLEKRQAGAMHSLARSLEMLASSSTKEHNAGPSLVGLRRERMKKISLRQRETLVAGYLRDLGVKNYGRTHVREILKRIDTRQKNLTFEMLGVVFRVTPDLLWASRV